jgi:RNA polymerase sigma-70 factor (ECF subfamily)
LDVRSICAVIVVRHVVAPGNQASASAYSKARMTLVATKDDPDLVGRAFREMAIERWHRAQTLYVSSMIRQPSSDTGDDHLMALYVGGDFSAFRRLFERLAPWVRRFFRRRFPDRAVADDLTQATFLRLHGARASYQLGRPVKPWLFAIAAGVGRDELRRRRRQLGSLVDVALDDNEAFINDQSLPVSTPPAAEANDAVRAAIRALPESQRVVIQLHQYEGFTFEQIAVRLNTTPGAVRVRASRAYERLREQLRPFLSSLRTK